MNDFSYFENRSCRYYPCHESDNINCLFCYCPLMFMECSEFGDPKFIETSDGIVKDCSQCLFPHKRENYPKLMSVLKDRVVIKGEHNE